MSIPLRTLIIEDSAADAKLVLRELRRGGYDPVCERVETRDEMRQALDGGTWDIIISDFRLPEFSGSDALEVLKQSGRDIPFVIVSGSIGEINAVEAMRAGANDYVMKDNLARLAPAISRELREAEGRRERKRAELERENMRIENERLLREQAEQALQQRAFIRDVLYSVTEGKLRLCDTRDDLPPPMPDTIETIPVVAESLRELRKRTEDAARSIGLSQPRVYDLISAVAEASMNAVVHSGGGEARISRDENRVQVRVEDHGLGIDIGRLPRATLERGYTTAGSLGHGFFMMLNFADRVFLLTGPTGTTIVLEQYQAPPEPAWLQGVPHVDAC